MKKDQQSQDSSGKDRFIAGAVCPSCRALDRLKVRETPAGALRLCVSCGFNDLVAVSATTDSALPRGRLAENRAVTTLTDTVEAQPQVIRVLDPNADNS